MRLDFLRDSLKMIELLNIVWVNLLSEDLLKDKDYKILAICLKSRQEVHNLCHYAIENGLPRHSLDFFHRKLHETEQHLDFAKNEIECFSYISAQLSHFLHDSRKMLVFRNCAFFKTKVEHVKSIGFQTLKLDRDFNGRELENELAVAEQGMLAHRRGAHVAAPGTRL